MIEIPPEVLNAFWAFLIIILGWLAAIIQTIGKGKAEDEKVEAKAETKAVIDYYDPTVPQANTPPEIIPERTYKMSDETKRWITFEEPPEFQKVILEQVEKAEASGQATYRVSYGPGYYYDIEYGLVKGSGPSHRGVQAA